MEKQNKELTYLDYNATTPISPDVLAEMQPYMTNYFANPSCSYDFANKSKIAIQKAKSQIANLINCHKDEIYFTSGATESNNWVLKGLSEYFDGKVVFITSKIEHPSVYETIKYIKSKNANNVDIKYLESNITKGSDKWEKELGDIIKELDLINNNTRVIVSIMAANNETGVITDIDRIANFLKINKNISHKIFVHTDATQYIGKVKFDFKNEYKNIDFVSLCAHKIYGPKGVGALVIKNNHPQLLNTLICGSKSNIRNGTENVPGIVGFGAACFLMTVNLDSYRETMYNAKNYIWSGIWNICTRNSVSLIKNFNDASLPNTINFTLPEFSNTDLIKYMNENNICIAAGSACTANRPDFSRSVYEFDKDKKAAEGSIRISLGVFNTRIDFDNFLSTLANFIVKEKKVINE